MPPEHFAGRDFNSDQNRNILIAGIFGTMQ